MKITHTKCRLSDLTDKQIASLQAAMPKSDLFHFSLSEPFIGFSSNGRSGTWRFCKDDALITYKEMMALLKPKWTIYNNELKWSALSDKQKGKMLLATHSGVLFGGTKKPIFNNSNHPYKAVKPKPTMAELFLADWLSTSGVSGCGRSEQMITKGWVNK